MSNLLIIGISCACGVSFLLGVYLGFRTVKPVIERDIREHKMIKRAWDKGVL